MLAVLGLFFLAPISAEYLLGYDDIIGRPWELVFGLLIFGPLYGAPALLIREAARRAGRGWPTILTLSFAAGLIQAGLIDQSLFNPDYRGIPYWADLRVPTYLPGLGLLRVHAARVRRRAHDPELCRADRHRRVAVARPGSTAVAALARAGDHGVALPGRRLLRARRSGQDGGLRRVGAAAGRIRDRRGRAGDRGVRGAAAPSSRSPATRHRRWWWESSRSPASPSRA